MKTLCILFCIPAMVLAQRLQPGKLYEAGETLYAPRFGFTAKVPQGWEGMLPRDTEVFLLTTTTATYGEIFVFGRDAIALETLQQSWQTGIALSENIKLTAIQSEIKNEMLTAEVSLEGPYVNKENRGFAITRCNPEGPCITTLMIAPNQFYESVKQAVLAFMTSSSFSPLSNASPYASFDWKNFLNGKELMTYAEVQGGKKENRIHLCADGTFSATLKKTGLFASQNAQYKGNLKGTWTVGAPGESTTIRFSFAKEKLPPIEVTMTIKDEKIFSNGERYFAGKSTRCN
jgi:hypothetical protein